MSLHPFLWIFRTLTFLPYTEGQSRETGFFAIPSVAGAVAGRLLFLLMGTLVALPRVHVPILDGRFLRFPFL